jgi:hypothetical protein
MKQGETQTNSLFTGFEFEFGLEFGLEFEFGVFTGSKNPNSNSNSNSKVFTGFELELEFLPW